MYFGSSSGVFTHEGHLSFPASAAEKVHIGSEQRVSRLVKTAAYPTSLYMYDTNKDKII